MTEQEEQDLRAVAELGRKVKISAEIFKYYILQKRAGIIDRIETGNYLENENPDVLALKMQLLKDFELWGQSCIDMGEIAEKELEENG